MMKTKYQISGAYHWGAYVSNPKYRLHVDTIVKFFAAHRPGTLLDAGCGDGFISHMVAGIGYGVIGIDSDALAIRLARAKTDRARFAIKEISKVRGIYDYVLASNVIEHVKDDREFLAAASRIAQRGTLVSTITQEAGLKPDPYDVRTYTDSSFVYLVTSVFRDVMIFNVRPETYAWCVGRK